MSRLNPDHFRTAATTIETYGWFRANPSDRWQVQRFPAADGTKCFCVLTAMPVLALDAHVSFFLRFLGVPEEKCNLVDILITWNDLQDNAEVVISHLRACADYLENSRG